MFLSERIAAIAPAQAVFFRLLAQRHDDKTQVYPVDPGSYFHVGESPYGIPSGNYTICFYTEQKQPLPHHNQPLRIDIQSEVHQASQSQLSLYRSGPRTAERTAAGAGSAARPALNTSVPATPAKTIGASAPHPPEGVERAQSATSATENDDLEFRKYTYAMDLEDRQQEFIKNSAYVTEVGEVFALNRIMRRELMELQRIIVLNSQQAYKDVAQVKSTVHDLLDLQRDVLANAAQTLTRPPAPPPDYVGLGHSALATIREIGVAIVQRGHARESGPDPGKASPPQLPAASLPSAEASPAPAVPKADIIDRMVSKLRATTDEDIALAMSSPDQWKAMLDGLRSGSKEPSAQEPAQPKHDASTES